VVAGTIGDQWGFPTVCYWNGNPYIGYIGNGGNPYLMKVVDGDFEEVFSGGDTLYADFISLRGDGSYLKVALGSYGDNRVRYYRLDQWGNFYLRSSVEVGGYLDGLSWSEGDGRVVLFYETDDGVLRVMDLEPDCALDKVLTLDGVIGFGGGVSFVGGDLPWWRIKSVREGANPDLRDGEAELPSVNVAFIYGFVSGGDYVALKRWYGIPDLIVREGSGGPQGSGSRLSQFRVTGVRPNPASSRAVRLGMYLPEKSSVRLRVYDVTGRVVLKNFFKGIGPGEVRIPIGTERLSAGVYFYQVELKDRRYLGKFSLLR